MRCSLITRAFTLATLMVIPLGADYQVVFAQDQFEHPKFPPLPHERQQPAVERNLKTFDLLDFDVFSNQKWDRLGESHAADIIVTWPDGHETKGIQKHIDFGSGSWITGRVERWTMSGFSGTTRSS
jgi:hypothetical protein